MRHPVTPNKREKTASPFSWHAHTLFMGDSLEVMEEYHREKVEVLESTLQQLNLLDNAREIAFLCREVVLVKEALHRIYQKKKFLA